MVRRSLLPRKLPGSLRIGARCAGQDKRMYQVQWANSAKKTKVWRLAKTQKAKPKKRTVLTGGSKPVLSTYAQRFVRTLQDYAENKANQPLDNDVEYVVFKVLLPLLHKIHEQFEVDDRQPSKLVIKDDEVKNDLGILLRSIQDEPNPAASQLIRTKEFQKALKFVEQD